MKKRINIYIDGRLHEWAVDQSAELPGGFSEYVENLIRNDRGDIIMTGDEVRNLPAPLREILQSTAKQRRASEREQKAKAKK